MQLSFLSCMMRRDDYIVALAAKIVEDILLCGLDLLVPDMVYRIKKGLTLVKLVHASGSLHYFGINLVQRPDKSVPVDGEDKLAGIHGETVTRVRRLELDSPLNALEATSCASVNVSVRCLGITVSQMSAEFSSRLHQLAPQATV